MVTEKPFSFLKMTEEERLNFIVDLHKKRRTRIIVEKKRVARKKKKEKAPPPGIDTELLEIFDKMPDKLKKMLS
jgi:hypothetical protein